MTSKFDWLNCNFFFNFVLVLNIFDTKCKVDVKCKYKKLITVLKVVIID